MSVLQKGAIMQTFLPYEDFLKSASVLDDKRLGKQRVESMQILNTLETGNGWKHHPIVKMWKGHEQWLVLYTTMICQEWKQRGFQDTVLTKVLDKYPDILLETPTPKPHWLGNEELHSSHRSNLLRKDANHYKQFGWSEQDDKPYLWWTPEKDWYNVTN